MAIAGSVTGAELEATMNLPMPTLVFYAVATFLLGAIAWAALGPYAAIEGTAAGTLGPIGGVRLVVLVVGIVGPLLFIVQTFLDAGRDH